MSGPTDPRDLGDPRLRHGLLFEQHPDAIFELGPEGRFLSANAALESLTGHTAVELLTMTYRDFIHPDDVARVDDHFAHAMTGERRSYTTRGVGRSGDPLTLQVTKVPIVVDEEVLSVYGIVREISEEMATREALEVSEGRFRGLFEGSGSGIAISDLDGRFVEANPAFLRMLGYRHDELEGVDFLAVTHPDDREESDSKVRELRAGEVPSYVIEKRFLASDGRSVWVRAGVSLIRGADGRPHHVAATTEDITDAKAAGARLRRSESLRRLAGELAAVGGWSVEAVDRTVYWSEEIYRIIDAPPGDEPSLDDAMSLYGPADRERMAAAIEACLVDGTGFDLELELTTYRGRVIPVRVTAEAQRNPAGVVERVIGAFQDITDLRAATIRAERSARRLTATLESTTDAIYMLDDDWRFTYINQRAADLLQRQRDDLIGRQVWEEFPDTVDSPLSAAYRRAVSSGRPVSLDEYHYEPLQACFSVNAYPSDQGLAVYFRDVTAALQARAELEEREKTLQRQAELLDEAQDAILVRDVHHRITYWNRSAERVYGWPAQEAIGADIRELLYDDPRPFDRATQRVFDEGSWTGELEHRHRSGETLTVAGRWTLVRGEDGRPEAVLAINSDITEQKRVEQQLLRAQRMESLGTLAGGVAHDLNNVLSPILLATDLLQIRGLDDQVSELLDTIASSARRGADLVAQVLSFARGVEGQRAPVDMAGLLDDIRGIVRDTFPKDIRLVLDVQDGIGTIVGDRTQIQQVLLNLAVNARDAMPNGGKLLLTASEVLLDEQYVSATPGTVRGDYLLVEVEDDGTGMPEDILDRVFEPFFTTKPHGAGTGLGLSISAAIVRSHGGFLRVYSELGHGTRFRLYLPLDRGGSETSIAVSGPAELLRGDGRTVLVVDDEASVRAMTRQTLEAYGYEVLEAANGAEAVASFTRNRGTIDVVLTDMMMPVMDGPTAIRAMKDIDPEVLVVGASGLHGNGKVAEAADVGVRYFLSKPYTSARLLETLRDILTSD